MVVKGVRKTTKELKETLKKYKLEDLRTELKALGIQVNEDQDKKTRKNDKKLKRELRKVLLRELKRVELQRQENKGEESEADEAPEVLQERVELGTEVGQEESEDRQQAADMESTGQQQDGDSTENGPMREKKRMENVALVIKILDDITDMDEVNDILNEAVSILSEYKDIPQIHSNTYPSNQV